MDEIGQIYESLQGISDLLTEVSGSVEEIGETEVGEINQNEVGAVARRRRFRSTQAGSKVSNTQAQIRRLEKSVSELQQLAKELKVKSKRGALSQAISSAGREVHLASVATTATASTTYNVGQAQDATRANVVVAFGNTGTVTIQDLTHQGNSLFSKGTLNMTVPANRAFAAPFSERVIQSQDNLGAVLSAAASGDGITLMYLYVDPSQIGAFVAQINSK